ncbi:hypothetical protein ASD50_20675 [Mesorhizobium sp. Root552]|uniref:hypothetical protein n=1 Tax=Mesorhizobium sp. Root552 TaxID=1736555 RepID=UPI0006FF54FC|nr:hypothetical protein [Mesorhizobium sp. Root552]KQZ25840.1 hypothetical protein ASD50_20675 [Mesorhizobium sp. Root552]
MATTVFTPSAGVLNGNDTNPNTSFRVRCVLTAASSGKLQVTFTASTATGLTASNASIGKWDGTNNPFTTTVPVELKFGGASGFSIPAGGTITSDLTDHSAAFSLALGESVLVDLDCTSPSGQRYRGSNSNVDTWYALGATGYNLPTPAGYSKLAGVDYAVEKVETDSAGTAYTLTCDAGSFTIGGTAASLKAALNLTASAGAFAITGTAATLRAGYGLPADAGSFAIGGTAASLKAGFALAANAGTFVIAGTAAALRAGTVLSADAGAFVISGADAALKASRVLVAESGAFIWTGTDADLIDDTGTTSYVLEAEPGSFQITGTDANLVYVPKVIPADPDQFDTHDGRVWDFTQSERDDQERVKARRASEKQLRRAIERAVNIVRGSGEVQAPAPAVEQAKPDVAEMVMLDINTNGLSASLESIERLLAQYEAQIADEELENDALALLLLAA